MHNAWMDETKEAQGRRLAQARIAKGIATGAEAARRLRVHVITYNQHENGTRGFKREAARYARFYGVQLKWLWEGTGPMKEDGKDPRIERLEALTPENQLAAMRYLDYLRSTQE